MSILGAIVRVYSYLFHLVLSLFVLAIAFVTLTSGANTLQMEMLPWKNTALLYWLLALGLVGIMAVVLAVTRKLPILFLIWSVVVFVLLVRGYIFSPYTFNGVADFSMILLLLLGALLACIGAWLQFRRKTHRRRYA